MGWCLHLLVDLRLTVCLHHLGYCEVLPLGLTFFSRICTGVFCWNRGLRLANEADAQAKKAYILRFSGISLAWLALMPVVWFFSGVDSWHFDALVLDVATFALFGVLLYDFWPSRFGTLFSCIKPTERMHPYSEFGLDS